MSAAGHTVMVVGSSGAGKSSLVRRFVRRRFEPRPDSYLIPLESSSISMTLGAEGQAVCYTVIEVTGDDRFKYLARPLFRDAAVVVIVYDVTDEDSYLQATEHWLRDSLDQCPHARLVLVGTKTDLSHDRVVSRQRAEYFAEGRSLIYTETSSLTGENVKQLFNTVGHMCLLVGRHFELSLNTAVTRIRRPDPQGPKPRMCPWGEDQALLCCAIS